jgi:hypothetical protein
MASIDISGTTFWCYRFMNRHGLSMWHDSTVTKITAQHNAKILKFKTFVTAVKKKRVWSDWQHG